MTAYAAHGRDFNVDEVARRAGVSKQAIYRRWPTKLALLLDAIEAGLEVMLRETLEELPEAPLPALHVLARRIYDSDHVMRMRFTLHMLDHARDEPHIRHNLREWDRRAREPVIIMMRALCVELGLDETAAAAKSWMLHDVFSAAGFRQVSGQDLMGAAGETDFEGLWGSFLPVLSR